MFLSVAPLIPRLTFVAMYDDGRTDFEMILIILIRDESFVAPRALVREARAFGVEMFLQLL